VIGSAAWRCRHGIPQTHTHPHTRAPVPLCRKRRQNWHFDKLMVVFGRAMGVVRQG